MTAIALSTDDTTATIPAELFYWAHIPDPGSFHRGRLISQAERLVPVDVDTLHQCWARLPAGAGWLMIGIEPHRLRQHLAGRSDISPRIWALVPSGIPAHLPGDSERVRGRLNCLWGPFEPAPRRRLRLTCGATAAVGGLLVIVALLVGMECHRHSWLQIAAAVTTRTTQRLQDMVPGDPGLPADQRLVMELRRLEASAGLGKADDIDVPGVLQTLINGLPRDLRVQTEALSVTSDRISWRARVVDLASAERLQQACASVAVSGFRPQPLQAQQGVGYALAVIDLVRSPVQP